MIHMLVAGAEVPDVTYAGRNLLTGEIYRMSEPRIGARFESMVYALNTPPKIVPHPDVQELPLLLNPEKDFIYLGDINTVKGMYLRKIIPYTDVPTYPHGFQIAHKGFEYVYECVYNVDKKEVAQRLTAHDPGYGRIYAGGEAAEIRRHLAAIEAFLPKYLYQDLLKKFPFLDLLAALNEVGIDPYTL